MHHLPVQRMTGRLGRDECELLELCAEGRSASVMAALLGTIARPDGRPTV